MSFDVSPFRFPQDKPFRIHKAKSKIDDVYDGDDDYRKKIERLRGQINDVQKQMYAHDRYAMLAVFQAMDAAGKDSTNTHVFTGVSPTSVDVHSFKSPTPEELDHDYLWRAYLKLPARGHIGVFNRSYYEEVLICKVHPEIVTVKQRLPEKAIKDLKHLYHARYRAIAEFEKHLHSNGTHVVKFFLHVSKKEQAKRFLSRLDDPSKNWKFDEADLSEREHWDEYMKAYQKAINKTATEDSPWYVIPADDKKAMRLLVAEALLTEMRRLHLEWPQLPKQHRDVLERSRRKLAEEVS